MKRKRGLPTYPGSNKLTILLSLLISLEAFIIIGQAVFLARAITFLFQGEALASVVQDILLFLMFFVLRHILLHAQQLASEKFALTTSKMLREKLVNAYFKLGPRFVQVNGTGSLVRLAIEGIEQVRTYFALTSYRMIRTVIIPSIIAIYIFTQDISSSLIVIATVPIIILFMILLGMAAQKKADDEYESYRKLSNHFIDTLKGIETLTYLGKSKKHEEKITSVSRQYRKATIRTLRIAFLSSFALDFFTSLSIAFVAVGLGFRLIDGSIILLPALTILILAPDYFLPIRQVGTDYHATLDGQVALAQIETIIATEENRIEKTSSSPINWQASQSMSFQNISVCPEDSNKKVLNDIQFNWNGTGLIGIVGESGAGKSTLIDVLAGFLKPTTGSITISGEQTDTLMRDDWTNQIAYIPQHPYIFPTSIKENIRFYEVDAKDEEIEQVIIDIGLAEFVRKLPNKMNEKIGEGGRQLSGGQEQRIAMARALLSKRSILLLDEPTAHLDIETEVELKATMRKLFENKLVFIATHRIHWMQEMDVLLVLQNGHLVEQGTHTQLLGNNGAYADLVNFDVEAGAEF